MFTHAAVGGTFDHFHAGHRALLHAAFENAHKVSIGIVKNPSRKKLLSTQIEQYPERLRSVETYLDQARLRQRTRVFELTDIYGITIEERSLDALVITPETRENGVKINQLRKDRNMHPLHCIEIEPVLATDGELLSSTRIRSGEVNREGLVYRSLFEKNSFTVEIPASLRAAVSKPMGDIVQGDESNYEIAAHKTAQVLQKKKPVLIITIGDVVTETLYQAGVVPDVSIIDYRTRRAQVMVPKQYGADEVMGPVQNPAGTIQDEAALAISQAMQDSLKTGKHIEVVIEGEEDLMGIPVVMTAPLGSIFVYGQHGSGIVLVEVTEEQKLHYLPLLR